jgi:hypothetical protein
MFRNADMVDTLQQLATDCAIDRHHDIGTLFDQVSMTASYAQQLRLSDFNTEADGS